MIKYDYTIERDEKDEIVLYQPSFEKELDDLVYIEGRNNSGKSTLLNVIALAMQGAHKNSKVKEDLKYEISKLTDSENQKIGFEVQLTSKDKSITLMAEKAIDSSEIITYEIIKGKKNPLRGPAFANKYNLIYEIPSNPTKKLDNMLDTISLINSQYGNKISTFDSYIENLLTELEKDPKLKLPEWEKKHDDLKKKKEKLVLEHNQLKDLQKSLKYYTFVKLLQAALEELNRETARLKKLKKEEKKEKEKIPDHGADIQKIREERDNLIELFKKTGNYVQPILSGKKYKGLLEIWRSIGFDKVMKNCELDPSLTGVIDQIQITIDDERSKATSKESYKGLELIQALIDALEDFQDMDCEVPESGLLISDYLDKLRNKMKKEEGTLTLINNAGAALDLLGQLKSRVQTFENHWIPKLRETKESIGKPHDFSPDLAPEIMKVNAHIKILNSKITQYEAKCSELNIDTKNINRVYKRMTMTDQANNFIEFENYTDDQLLDKIRELNKKSVELTKKEGTIEFMEKDFKRKIEDAKKGKEHELIGYMDEIRTIHNKTQMLRTLFDINLFQTINHLRNKEKKELDNSKEKKRISVAISKYMARSLKTVYHNTKSYHVESLDFIEGKIDTKEGKEILIKQLGTGQGQSLYLRGLLETADERKIILLLDEVANMDPVTLNTVMETIIKLHDTNKLISAVVVQMGKKNKTISIRDKVSGG